MNTVKQAIHFCSLDIKFKYLKATKHPYSRSEASFNNGLEVATSSLYHLLGFLTQGAQLASYTWDGFTCSSVDETHHMMKQVLFPRGEVSA